MRAVRSRARLLGLSVTVDIALRNQRNTAKRRHASATAIHLQFKPAVEKMGIWSATNGDYSFVISYESLAGPNRRAGYLASWRLVYAGLGAIRLIGSPFNTFDEAEAACDEMLKRLISEN
jgi:hypothetical protein